MPRAVAGSPTWREVALVSLTGGGLSCLMHLPLVLHADRVTAHETTDSMLIAWQAAWNGHALTHQPLDLFQSNAFWPLPDSLAFSDAMVGYAPAGLIGDGPVAALVRYNVLFLFAYALAFVGAYLLARELGVRPLAASVAGVLFAYSPWRLGQDGHLHVLSSGGIPLCLFLLVRGYTRGRPGYVLAGWLVAAWQVSLGFALGLQLGYLLGVLVVLAVVWWLVRGRPPVGRGVAVASAVGIVLFVAVVGLMARPFLRVVDDRPEARRTYGEVGAFSPPLRGMLVAPEESRLWGDFTRDARAELPNATEQALLPGVTLLTLAVVGAARGAGSWKLRAGLVAGSTVALVFALGSRSPGNGRFAYKLLFDHAPGWQGIRTPGRLMTLVTLGLAMLAALAVERMAARGEREWRYAPALLCVGLAALGLVEGWGRAPYPTVPRQPAGLSGVAGPQLHLPSDLGRDSRFMLWSTDGFPAIVNGYGGFTPKAQHEIREAVKGFPDAASITYLRELGVRTVVLHRRLDGGWAIAAERPVDGLAVRRTDHGEIVVYEITG